MSPKRFLSWFRQPRSSSAAALSWWMVEVFEFFDLASVCNRCDALREELRKHNYLPILFDFEKPRSRDTDETITLLARMARFVIADVSDAKAVLQELRAIVPDLPSVPVQPIILAMQEEPGMFDFYRNFRSFLKVHPYASQGQLLADLGEKVIRPAERKVLDLRGST